LLLSLLSLLSCPPAATVAARGGVDAEVLAEIEQRIAGFVTAGQIVGAELLVIRDGRTIRHRGFGWRDVDAGAPMEPGTIFNLRSMAKPIVGSIAQRLVDRGELDLGAPVSRYLAAFEGEGSAAITVRQLLTHTSGLPDGNPAGRPSDYPTLKSVADYWGRHGPTAFPPGTGFLYSDPGADVLAVVLQEATGRTLPDLAQREVFGPLGMKDAHAFVDSATSADPRFASDYRWSKRDRRWVRYWQPGDGSLAPFPIGSGTTWYATAADYALLMTAWLNSDVEWLSPRAIARGLTPVSAMPYPNGLPGFSVHYGQMWLVYTDASGRRVAFGHSGSDGTYAYAWPEQDLVVLYMTQSRGNRTRLLLEPLFAQLAAED
jgi:CubicO group peptidase (beta-lactamase class C family)